MTEFSWNMDAPGKTCMLSGNEAAARGALEAGVQVAASYPGSPSVQILESLAAVARERGIYAEWSVNKKLALEVAAAASFSGLRALSVMKADGLNVAMDFLTTLPLSGIRKGLVRVVMNDRPFYPLDDLQKKSAYPPMDQLISLMEHVGREVRVVNGTDLAKEAGNVQALNMVMVGAFAGLNWVSLENEKYLKPIQETFSSAKLEVNIRAFELGYQAVSG